MERWEGTVLDINTTCAELGRCSVYNYLECVPLLVVIPPPTHMAKAELEH